MLAAATNAGASARGRAPLACLPVLPCTAPTTTTSTTSSPTVPPPPTADPGSWYDAHHNGELYASLRVSEDAKRIVELEFILEHGRCSGDHLFLSNVLLRPSSGASIDSAGRVSYVHLDPHTSFGTIGGRRIYGRQETKLSVTFAGTSASGTISVSFRSRDVRCSTGTMPFQAYREGSAGAPLSDSSLGTGSYRGEFQQTSGGDEPFSMDVFLPWDVIEVLRFKWQLDCPDHAYNEQSTFQFIPIKKDGWYYAASGKAKFRHGIRARWSYQLSGSGLGVLEGDWKGWRYNVYGTWSYQVQYTRRGVLLETCSQSGNMNAVGPPGSG